MRARPQKLRKKATGEDQVDVGDPEQLTIDEIQQLRAELLSLPVLQPEQVERLLREASERIKAHGWVLGSAASVPTDDPEF